MAHVVWCSYPPRVPAGADLDRCWILGERQEDLGRRVRRDDGGQTQFAVRERPLRSHGAIRGTQSRRGSRQAGPGRGLTAIRRYPGAAGAIPAA